MKSDKQEEFLRQLAREIFGTSATNETCWTCGKDIDLNEFRDDLSKKEYSISHCCQNCQDDIFNEDNEE